MTRALGFLAFLTAAGCITTTTARPIGGLPVATEAASPEDTTEARSARAREYIAKLTLDGIRRENQSATTKFLVDQLIALLPTVTPVLIAEGITHPSAKVRENCAFVLCYAGDKSAEEALMGLLNDPEEMVRFSAAASLVTGHGQKAGVPILLKGLYHNSAHVRRQCEYNLRIFTGQFFGFDADAPRSEREFAAAKWEDWWRRNGDDFLPPVIGRPVEIEG